MIGLRARAGCRYELPAYHLLKTFSSIEPFYCFKSDLKGITVLAADYVKNFASWK
jgi:hypothetical protein